VLRPSYASALGNAGDTVGNCSTDASLTTANSTVVVGQQLNLTGCVPANSGITVSSATWTPDPRYASNAVGGFSVIENFTNYQFTRNLTAAPSAPTCSSSQSCDFPTFYFTTPGTYVFTYQYALVNGSVSPLGTLVFTVQGPTPNADGHYIIDNSYVGDPGYPFVPGPIAAYAPGERSLTSAIMGSGNGASTTAIALTVDSGVKMPSGYSDTGWLLVQVINNISYSLRSNPSGSPFNLQPGLDTSYPYDFGTSFNDSPGMPLDTNYFGSTTYTAVGEKSMSLGFTVYLMWDPGINPANNDDCSIGSLGGSFNAPDYTPSSCSSIPVPFDAVSWGFSADSVKTLNPLQNTADGKYANSWYLTDGYPLTPNYAPAVYPSWACTENGAQFNRSISGTCALQ
jgi:hypothetical protein